MFFFNISYVFSFIFACIVRPIKIKCKNGWYFGLFVKTDHLPSIWYQILDYRVNINQVTTVQSNPTEFFQGEVVTKFESSINYYWRRHFFWQPGKNEKHTYHSYWKKWSHKITIGGGWVPKALRLLGLLHVVLQKSNQLNCRLV